MLDDLVQTIKTLRDRIKEHGHRIGPYESRTRAALIDPMLCALGWDVADPGVVDVEYDVAHKTDKKWIDYALLDGKRQPVCFVEAKKYEDKSRPVSQTIGSLQAENDAKNSDVRYCVSTNGDQWVVYDAKETPPAVIETSIMGEDISRTALALLPLWRLSLESRRLTKVHELPLEVPIQLTGSAADPVPISPSTPPPEPQPVASVPAAAISNPPSPLPPGWTALTANFPITNAPAPAAIRFPDGQEMQGRSWRRVIIETALWLHREGVLSKDNCQIKISQRQSATRYIFSSDGKHSGGTPFESPVAIGGTGIVLEGNLNARDAVSRTIRLLQHFSRDPSQVYLKLP